MPITTGTLSVPDFVGGEQKLKTLNDSADLTRNPAHPQLNAAGAIINPATAERQDTGNAALTAIAANTDGSATEAKQDTAISALSTIASNTALGSVNFSATPTVTAGAYAAGDVVGGKIAVTNAARTSAGSGIVQQAAVLKKTALTAPVDLFVFHTDPAATFTDNEPLPDLSADLGKLAGVIRCTELIDCGTPQVLQALQQTLQFKLATGTTLFVVPVLRGAETYASADAVTVSLGILRD